MTVKPDQITRADISIKVPVGDIHREKKYGFVIKTSMPDSDVPIEFFNKIYVTVPRNKGK